MYIFMYVCNADEACCNWKCIMDMVKESMRKRIRLLCACRRAKQYKPVWSEIQYHGISKMVMSQVVSMLTL